MIPAAVLLSLMIVALLWSCQGKRHDYKVSSQSVSDIMYDTSYVGIAEDKILDNRSDVQFCKALQLLKTHKNLEASIYIREGVTSLQKEDSGKGSEIRNKLDSAIADLLQMAAAARKGTLNEDAFANKYHAAEWMVVHDEIETWEQMPALDAKTNLHLRKTLQNINYKLISEDAEVKKEGECLLKEGYAFLKSSQVLARDTVISATHREAERIKSFVKKQI
ncbi:hypothetical protein [Xanthocytophaga flavus]|nr:hypothetical protein [Xanthocytophaga flavus]